MKKQPGLRLNYNLIQNRLTKSYLHVKIYPINHHPYKNLMTEVNAYYPRDNSHRIVTISSLLKKCRASINNHKKIEKYQKQLDKKFHNQVKIKLISDFHGRRKTLVEVDNKKFHYIWRTTLDKILVSGTGIPPKYANKLRRNSQSKSTKRSKYRFIHCYKGQHTIFIPDFYLYMEHYSTKEHVRAFCMKCNYGVNSKWTPTIYNLEHSNFNCPRYSYHCRFEKTRNQSKKQFLKWYKQQNNLIIPKLNRILKRYHNGSTSIVHPICNHCGYGSHGEWSSSISNLFNNHGRCPQCSVKHASKIKSNQTLHKFLKWYYSQNDFRFYDKNELNNFKNNKSRIHMICNHCGYGKHKEWFPYYNTLINKINHKCPNCNGKAKLTKRIIKYRIRKIFHNQITIKFLTNNISRKSRVRAFDHKYNIKWRTTVDDLLTGSRSLKYRRIKNSIVQRCYGKKHFLIWYKKQNHFKMKNPRELIYYTSQHMHIHMICLNCGYGKHDEWYPTINELLCGTGCPYCNYSLGERMTDNWLKEHHLVSVSKSKLGKCSKAFVHSYSIHIKDHINTYSLDFMVKLGYKYYAIECDGIQHFKPIDFSNKLQELYSDLSKTTNLKIRNRINRKIAKQKHVIKKRYIRQSKHDNQKGKWCTNHYVRMIRIKNIHNVYSITRIRTLVNKTLNKKLLPHIKKYQEYENNGYIQTSLF